MIEMEQNIVTLIFIFRYRKDKVYSENAVFAKVVIRTKSK